MPRMRIRTGRHVTSVTLLAIARYGMAWVVTRVRRPALPRAPSCHRPSVAERAGAARHMVQETSDGNVVRLFFLACLSPAAAASWELGRLAARGAETIALCAGRLRRPAAAYTFRSVLREHDGAPLPHTPHTEARTDGESRRRRVARTCTTIVVSPARPESPGPSPVSAFTLRFYLFIYNSICIASYSLLAWTNFD